MAAELKQASLSGHVVELAQAVGLSPARIVRTSQRFELHIRFAHVLGGREDVGPWKVGGSGAETNKSARLDFVAFPKEQGETFALGCPGLPASFCLARTASRNGEVPNSIEFEKRVNPPPRASTLKYF